MRPTIAGTEGRAGARRKLGVSGMDGGSAPCHAGPLEHDTVFATLLGSLPRPPGAPDASDLELVEAAVRAQEAAGLEPVTDGGLENGRSPLDRWLAMAGLTANAAKQDVVGPLTAARGGQRAAVLEA